MTEKRQFPRVPHCRLGIAFASNDGYNRGVTDVSLNARLRGLFTLFAGMGLTRMPQAILQTPTAPELEFLLHHNSYVDEQHRIVYIGTPKVACTSIKYMLRDLVKAKPLRFRPQDEHTSDVMRIHTRSLMPLATLGSFNPRRREDIMNSPDWFRFCVIRHPYDRFFSAWRDKIFIVEPGFEMHQLDKSKKFVEFSDFVDKAMTEDARACDVHWRLQVSLLMPDYFNYKHIYELSRVADMLVDLRGHLAAQGVTDKVLELPRNNESWSIRPDGFMTNEIMARLRAYYHLDFERFKFPEREPTAVTPTKAASLVNEYTNAIYDRNRVIMAHVNSTNSKRLPQRAVRYAMLKVSRSEPVIKGRGLLKDGARKLGDARHSLLSRRRPSTEP
jgi:hypothetical protein